MFTRILKNILPKILQNETHRSTCHTKTSEFFFVSSQCSIRQTIRVLCYTVFSIIIPEREVML